jgi:hypothetical protein
VDPPLDSVLRRGAALGGESAWEAPEQTGA